MNYGKGNRTAQNRRRRQRKAKLPDRQENAVELIDGNYSHFPVGYCNYHKGYVSVGQVEVHRCIEKECPRFKTINDVNSEKEFCLDAVAGECL